MRVVLLRHRVSYAEGLHFFPMRRHARIWLALIRAALQAELQYRANFFAKLLRNVGWLVFVLTSLFVIYGNAKTVGGWTRADAFVLVGTLFLVTAAVGLLFHSVNEIPSFVRLGTLDFYLTKPVDAQFWISVRRFDVGELGSLVAALALVVYGTWGLGVNPAQWGAYGIGLAGAMALYYSLNLALMTLGVWLVRVDNLWVLSETISGIARYPLDMYGAALRRLLVTWVPIGLLAYAPAGQLVKGLDLGSLGWTVAWALGALVASRFFWLRATKSYTSASS